MMDKMENIIFMGRIGAFIAAILLIIGILLAWNWMFTSDNGIAMCARDGLRVGQMVYHGKCSNR